MTEAQENELADMITDVAISYANGHATDFRIAAKAAIAFVLEAGPNTIRNAERYRAICEHTAVIDGSVEGCTVITMFDDCHGAALCDAIDASVDRLAPSDTLDMSIHARLADAESDVLRLHKEKMDLWLQVHGYESAGWKLVPAIPTTEMKIAGDNAGFWCGDKYDAMLRAAPKPKQQEPQ